MSLMWWTVERRFEMPDVISCSRTTNHSFNLRGKIKDQPQVSWSRDSMMSWHALAIRVKHASMQTCWPRLRLLINALSCEIVTWMVAKLTGRRRRRGEGEGERYLDTAQSLFAWRAEPSRLTSLSGSWWRHGSVWWRRKTTLWCYCAVLNCAERKGDVICKWVWWKEETDVTGSGF